jgi:hypothetical protein
MDVREKLVELLGDKLIFGRGILCEVASHLIDNGVTVQNSNSDPEVVCDRMIQDPNGSWHHQFRFKIGDKDWGVSKELPEELVASCVERQKWIPVTERLPKRNAEVLVCDTREDYVSIWEHIGDGLWFGNEVIWATEDITHWMPLPEPPKGE